MCFQNCNEPDFSKMKAEFIGMQEGIKGDPDFPDQPLFNLVQPGHPYHGTTMSLQFLLENGIEVPKYPRHYEKQTPDDETFDYFGLARDLALCQAEMNLLNRED